MEEVLRTSDGIALSTYRAVLKAAGIATYVFEVKPPLNESSTAAKVCRVMVSPAHTERARALISEYHRALGDSFADVDLSTDVEDTQPEPEPAPAPRSLLRKEPETFWWQEEDDEEEGEEEEAFVSYGQEHGYRDDDPDEDDPVDEEPEDTPAPAEQRHGFTLSVGENQVVSRPPALSAVYDELLSDTDEAVDEDDLPPDEEEESDDSPDDDRSPPIDDGVLPDGVSLTTLLGGRVQFLQPDHGYRAALDPVLLAAAVPAGPWKVGLDVGAGTGAAMLCVLARCPDKHVIGLEVQDEHSHLARRSIALNRWQKQAHVVAGDIRWRPSLTANAFDQVFSNPPFHGPGTRPPHAGRATAHMEDVPLEDWLGFCLKMLKPRGTLTVIHRADRLDELLACLFGKAGAIEVIPLWPKRGVAARRVIVRARKGMKTPMSLLPGLVLHNRDGSFTDTTEAILRQGISLDDALAGTAYSV
ncbi:methyltransferase [Insolitispirillum peregrinum]|uniref:methyltransferase n=1 Tax=Insolitispirillum peregrinum TaxID=80876 RepID=UPI003615A3CF